MDRPISSSKFVIAFLAALLAGCGAPPTPVEVGFEPLERKGTEIRLADLQGKVVVLDFWATWCGPCHETAPIVQRFHDDYKDRGVEVFGVTNESRGTVENFVKTRKQTYPIVLDLDNSVNDAFKITGYPTVVVIGKDRSVKFVGHPESTKDIRAAIESELAKN